MVRPTGHWASSEWRSPPPPGASSSPAHRRGMKGLKGPLYSSSILRGHAGARGFRLLQGPRSARAAHVALPEHGACEPGRSSQPRSSGRLVVPKPPGRADFLPHTGRVAPRALGGATRALNTMNPPVRTEAAHVKLTRRTTGDTQAPGPPGGHHRPQTHVLSLRGCLPSKRPFSTAPTIFRCH